MITPLITGAAVPWKSPNPDTRLLPLAHRPHASKMQSFLVSVTKDNWSGSVRCYHPEMHAAEVSVARELARLAASPPQNHPLKQIDSWIRKEEQHTGMHLCHHVKMSAEPSHPRCLSTYGTFAA